MATDVRNNTEDSRYELWVDGRLIGIADYVISHEQVLMPHTEIALDARGQGHGAVLVRAALDDVRGTGRRVVPSCWYVAQFIDENPDYADLVA